MTEGMRMAYTEQVFREILSRLCTLSKDRVKITVINSKTQKSRTQSVEKPERMARGLLEAEMHINVTLLQLMMDNMPEVYAGIKEIYDSNSKGVVAIEMVLSCGKMYQITADVDPKFGVTNSNYPRPFMAQLYNEASMIIGNFYVVV